MSVTVVYNRNLLAPYIDCGAEMAYIIEAHSHEEPRQLGGRGGTRELVVGGKGGLITPGQALTALLSMMSLGTWNRAYVIHAAHTVVCVWARGENETISCVAHTPTFRVRNPPPYLYENRTRVVSHTDAYGFRTTSERDEWASLQIRENDVGTAVVLHSGRVYYAWEPGPDNTALLVANGLRAAKLEGHKYSTSSGGRRAWN